MATGDISSVSVLANGYQVQATFEGMDYSAIAQVGSVTLNVANEHGFNSSGNAVTNLSRLGLRCTLVSATDSSGDAVCVFDIEEWQHGNGTITLTGEAGALDDGSESSTAFTSQPVTNNATNDYPVPFAQAISKIAEKVTSTYTFEVIAAAGAYKGHRSNYGIAAVVVDLCEPMEVSSISGTPTAAEGGETITGGTSGATAVMFQRDGNTLYLRDIDGTFSASETITGGTSGFTATYVSGGRKATKTITSMSSIDKIGDYGHRDSYYGFAVEFDIADDGDFGSTGTVDREWLTVDVKAYPKIGDTPRQTLSCIFSNTGTAYSTLSRYCDVRGTITLSGGGLSSAVSAGERVYNDTGTNHEFFVNEDYDAGATELSVSYIRGDFASSDTITADGGATGTIATVSWNGDDTNDGTSTGTPVRTLSRALRLLRNGSENDRASWSTIYHMGGRAVLGPYSFSNTASTIDGPVTITKAPGADRDDCMISGTRTSTGSARGGMRTSWLRLYDVRLDFKEVDYASPDSKNLTISSESASHTGSIMGAKKSIILEDVDLEHAGKENVLTGLPEYWSSNDFDGGTYIYGMSFSEINIAASRATVMRDCQASNFSADWARPINHESTGNRYGLDTTIQRGNITLNSIMENADPFGTGTHVDLWQFVGGSYSDYENCGFYMNLARDLLSVQIGPFFNAGTQEDDPWPGSRGKSIFMALNIQEDETPTSNSGRMQWDDGLWDGFYCYNNVFGDGVLFRNRYQSVNTWFIRNYFKNLIQDTSMGTALVTDVPKTGWIQNHTLEAATSDSVVGFDQTEGGTVATLFVEFGENYRPISGGTLDGYGYDDPIMPYDAYGTAWPTDGSASITALMSASVEDLTGAAISDGTIRMSSSRASGLWASGTITPDLDKIVSITADGSPLTPVSASNATGGGSAIQSILTTDPLVPQGATLAIEISQGYMTDADGNTTGALDDADADNGSEVAAGGGGAETVKGNYGTNLGIRIGV